MALLRCIAARIRSLIVREDGATAIEYGLIVAGIALAISIAVYAVGDHMVAMFDELTSYLQS